MKRQEINLRDPYVLLYEEKYYLYGTCMTQWSDGKGYRFECYVSEDKENWDGPYVVFRAPEHFWANSDFWAPEVHLYKGRLYLFASFYDGGDTRGTHICVSDSPMGPFVPISEYAQTPRGWKSLDGTLYVDKKGVPYMVFCHEWLQCKEGEFSCVRLSDDLTVAEGAPKVLFKASQGKWTRELSPGDYVSDGPFVWEMKDGRLAMLWSSFGKRGVYMTAVAYSDNGRIEGPWRLEDKPLFAADGGHGMLFYDKQGILNMVIHAPNNPSGEERVHFIPVIEEDGKLRIR